MLRMPRNLRTFRFIASIRHISTCDSSFLIHGCIVFKNNKKETVEYIRMDV